MGLELEFKYALTGPDQLEQLCQALGDAFGPWEAVDMATVYYDTQDKALAARCWTLRVRQENGIPVLTMKTPGPGGARREWELPGGSLMDLPRLQALGAPPEVVALGPDQLAPQCGAGFGGFGVWPGCRMWRRSWRWIRACSWEVDGNVPFGSWRRSGRAAAERPWLSGAGVWRWLGTSGKSRAANLSVPLPWEENRRVYGRIGNIVCPV